MDNAKGKDIIALLRRAGIQRNTHSWDDYEAAKRAVLGSRVLEQKEFYAAIRTITRYLGI